MHITINLTVNVGDYSAVVFGGTENCAEVTCCPLPQELADTVRSTLAEFLREGATIPEKM